MKRTLVWLVAAALTVVGAVTNGVYSQRWGEPAGLAEAGAAIERLPEAMGLWSHVDDGEPLTPFVSNELGLVNHVNRWYEHANSGRRVQILMMVGQPGPLVRHPPTVCYANRAHEQLGPEKWIIDRDSTEPCRFRLLTYRPSRSEGDERFFVAYSHTTGTGWDAPDYPRVVYGSAAALYKVQIVANLTGEDSEADVVTELRGFVQAFTASFRETIAPNLGGPVSAD